MTYQGKLFTLITTVEEYPRGMTVEPRSKKRCTGDTKVIGDAETKSLHLEGRFSWKRFSFLLLDSHNQTSDIEGEQSFHALKCYPEAQLFSMSERAGFSVLPAGSACGLP